ncbi:MAG: transcriptional repressor [Anaerovoracaceae bacterium]
MGINNEYKTNNRTKILTYLKENQDRTVSVMDIDCHLRDTDSQVNLTTIYRYLDKLTTDGNVMKYISERGDKATFQYVERDHKCDEHLHLKCTECGEIIHLDCHFMEEISHHINEDHGFDLQCKNSVLYGVCKNCRAKNVTKAVE